MRRTLLSLFAVVACAVQAGPAVRAQAPAVPAAPPAAISQAPLPSVQDILQRSRAAVGGEARIRKDTSRRFTGRFDLPAQGISGPFELASAAPNRMVLRIELGGLGELLRGYDGTVGWSVDPAIGPRVLQGRELDEARHSADFYAELYDPAGFSSIEVVERTTFEGRPCYAVKFVRPYGLEVIEYFDAATGLSAGTRMSSTSAMGTMPAVVTVLEDYKSFDGLMLPTRARQQAMGLESVLVITSVEFGTVPASAFALPPAIQTLLGQQKGQ